MFFIYNDILKISVYQLYTNKELIKDKIKIDI